MQNYKEGFRSSRIKVNQAIFVHCLILPSFFCPPLQFRPDHHIQMDIILDNFFDNIIASMPIRDNISILYNVEHLSTIGSMREPTIMGCL